MLVCMVCCAPSVLVLPLPIWTGFGAPMMYVLLCTYNVCLSILREDIIPLIHSLTITPTYVYFKKFQAKTTVPLKLKAAVGEFAHKTTYNEI